jgi:hypothetical protein
MEFFKLFTPPSGRKPYHLITVFYRGVPLYTKAVFENDRYSFQLPLNLRDKMITGNLYADLCYSEGKETARKSSTPISLILSDRYE